MPRDYRIGMSTRSAWPASVLIAETEAKRSQRAIRKAELIAEAERKNRERRARMRAEERGEPYDCESEETRRARLEFEQTRDRLAQMEAELFKKYQK